MFENIPHFGPFSAWCRHSGMGRSLSIEMANAGTLPTVTIEGRQWIDIHAGLTMLHEAAKARTPVHIPGEERQIELARKAKMRAERRAQARAIGRRNRRRTVTDPEALPAA